MIIRVAEVPEEGRKYTGVESSSILGLECETEIKVDGPLEYDFYAQTAPGELIVRGSVSVPVSFRCSKCGEPFRMMIKDPSFMSVQEVDKDQSVDLTDEMREAIILSFPNYPACKPDCKGLCARCGMSLNNGKCSCKVDKGNIWVALDGLELK